MNGEQWITQFQGKPGTIEIEREAELIEAIMINQDDWDMLVSLAADKNSYSGFRVAAMDKYMTSENRIDLRKRFLIEIQKVENQYSDSEKDEGVILAFYQWGSWLNSVGGGGARSDEAEDDFIEWDWKKLAEKMNSDRLKFMVSCRD